MAVNALEYSLDVITSRDLKPALIVGWNMEAITLYDRIVHTPALGYDVRLFLRLEGETDRKHYKNVPVLSGLNNLAQVVRQRNISEALIVLSPAEKQYLPDIVDVCTELGLSYQIVSDAYDEEYGHLVRDVIHDVIGSIDFGPRRIFDFLGSLFLLILLSPVFLVTAVAIRLESKGPVFYTQQRLGKEGKVFRVYKFRSMVPDAEGKSGPVWAQKQDPRITKVGRFMRKTRIDELPQLMNVLEGDMSFIGPRPERPFFVEAFRKKIPFYMNRLKARPGITGLAQVTVGYDETLEDVKEKVARDIEYIEHMDSWMMNLKIILKTVLVVLRGEGQ